MYLIILY